MLTCMPCCAVLCVGMEAAIANLLEPGEKIMVGNAGIWGERVADLSARYGGEGCCWLGGHAGML